MINTNPPTSTVSTDNDSYEARLKAIISAIPDLILLFDERGKYVELFTQDEKLLYKQKRGTTAKEHHDLFDKKLKNYFTRTVKRTLAENALNIIEYALEIEREFRSFEARFMPTDFRIHGRQTVIIIIRDITEAKHDKEQLEQMANYDSLTSLPNRVHFNKRLKRAITRAKRKRQLGALFFLDIDRFKEINDNLGHDIGDELLVRCAMRLKTILRSEDTLARFGGDEFILIAENLASQNQAVEIAQSIMHLFHTPLRVKKYRLDISTSIGITLFPEYGSHITTLIQQADTAMYHAKDRGRNNFQFFNRRLAEQSYEFFTIESQFKYAFSHEEFFVLYQPQVRLTDQHIIAVEALLRWNSAELGMISPMKFIPIAEKAGIIEHLTNYVLESVCRQIKRWDQEGCTPFVVAINLSRIELGSEGMAARLLKIIKKHAIPFERLEFEVTEGALMENSEIAFKNIEQLRAYGILVSIDDFGTGFSSLASLKEFFFDKLKIDKSFVQDISHDRSNETIIKATIAMAKSLNLKVIAEGVETQEQLTFLINNGCDEMQGYFFSPPIPPDEIQRLLKRRKRVTH